jgi:hypothetical protein
MTIKLPDSPATYGGDAGNGPQLEKEEPVTDGLFRGRVQRRNTGLGNIQRGLGRRLPMLSANRKSQQPYGETCCRFAADAPTIENRFNCLLLPPTGASAAILNR